ncbi:hypothetical protein KIN20_025199 [Parelaphostrongylus tenuis]|uniref:Uncharacterized protein n=1 Tax=Parelaphostrongylus tenuis TaxID=148309 RepID=A0AAD5MUU0_PARTN|nr:hypothetical protein KIN20_025199 [Parelaphostrongylus tenuis]
MESENSRVAGEDCGTQHVIVEYECNEAIQTCGWCSGPGRSGRIQAISSGNRKWLENVMKELVKESDPACHMDTIMTSLHSTYMIKAECMSNESVLAIKAANLALSEIKLVLNSSIAPVFKKLSPVLEKLAVKVLYVSLSIPKLACGDN